LERTNPRMRNFLHRLFILPVPTARMVGLAALGIPIALAWGLDAALMLDGLLLGLAAADWMGVRKSGPLKGTRYCPTRFFEGAPAKIKIRVTNGGEKPLRLRIRDETPRPWKPAPLIEGEVPEKGEAWFLYTITPPTRGEAFFGDLWLRIIGPLGLFFFPSRIPASRRVRIYPPVPIRSQVDLSTHRRLARRMGMRPTRLLGGSREFDSLREYVEGDDPRAIHWKATARMDRPIVREYRADSSQSLLVALDIGRLMGMRTLDRTKLDHALEAALRLCQAALSVGDQVGLLAFSHHVVSFLPPSTGPAQLQRLLEASRRLAPETMEPYYEGAMIWLRRRLRRRSLILLFTDLVDEAASDSLLHAISLLRPRHLPICVAVRAEEEDRMLHSPPTSPDDVFTKAVLHQIQKERRRAMRALEKKGSLALDLPPSRLASGTLQCYLEVKRRGLL